MSLALRSEDIHELRGALKSAVAELQAYSLRITRINEITLAVSRSLSLSAILDVVWSHVRWVLDYEHFEIALRLGPGWSRLSPGDDAPGVALDGHPLFDSIVHGRPGVHADVGLLDDRPPFGTVMLVPLVSENQAIGALVFGRDPPGAYSGDDLRIASMLGLQLASVIRNAERYGKLQVLTARLNEVNRRRRELLHNMLPADVADELLRDGSVEPVHFDCATVMFIDFVGFTVSAAEMTPKALLARLDDLFTAFDAIIARHGLEKLKTIGDAYMCVGGVPRPWPGHTRATIDAALEILDHLEGLRRRGERVWPARIGIHAGPLIAGIIGAHKYAYDVWGDTVNLAARLEAAGVPGEINASAAVIDRVGEGVDFSTRGRHPVKGVGDVEMFTVDRTGDPGAEQLERPTLPMSATPRRMARVEQELTILLIEDDPDDVLLVQRALRGTSIEIIVCQSIDDARPQAARAGAVLLDLHLGTSIGLETISRARSALPSVPIVVLTGMDDAALGVATMRYGADDYLEKTRDIARLEAVIRRAVARADYQRRARGL